jgi:hypothetical protein
MLFGPRGAERACAKKSGGGRIFKVEVLGGEDVGEGL